jgi:hypothetical protein
MTRDASVAGYVVRWAARIGSLASLTVIFLLAGGPSGRPTPTEAIGLLLFPVGVVVGIVVAWWWREGVGGAISVLSLAAFYGWMTILDGTPPGGPYFVLLAAPGFLFLVSRLLNRSCLARAHSPVVLSA